MPILQLGLSGEGLSESQLNDYGLNFIRPQLITIPGAVIPNVYGGRQRSIMINLDALRLQADGLSPVDVISALNRQNVVEPGGTAKIGSLEYDVKLNSSPSSIEGLGNIPIKQVKRRHHLHQGRRQRRRRQHPPDQRRPPERPPRRAHLGPQVR